MGGLTLSRENTKLRPEYEDILRFYGFDLSSIEQETNVTVNMGVSSDTTKLPMSTVSSTIPIETIDTGNEDATTITLTITTLSSETTITPATAMDITQQSVTTDAVDLQSITVASSESAVLSTSSATSSLSAIIFGKNIQPASTTVITDSQSNPTTVLVATDQNPQVTSTVATKDVGTDETVAKIIVPNAAMENVENPNANIQVPHGLDTTTAANANAMSDEIPTNISPTTITTIVVDATPVNNISVIDANTVTSNSLIPAISMSLPSAINSTTPSPVTKTMTDNSVFLQSSRILVEALPTRNTTPKIITPKRDLTMPAIIDIDDDAITMTISSIQATNTTTPTDLIANLSNSANFMDDQVIASMKGNTISMNRKKNESESDLKVVMDDGTVKDESTSPTRERKARSPRGYFSSYPGTLEHDLR